MIGVSDEVVEDMLDKGKLARVPNIWCVRILLPGLASLLQLPIDLLVRELKEIPERPPKDVKSDEERGLVQLKFRFDPVIVNPVVTAGPQHRRTTWPKARAPKAKGR